MLLSMVTEKATYFRENQDALTDCGDAWTAIEKVSIHSK